MTATDFAREIIEGSGGMNDFEAHEIVAWHASDRVAAAIWTMRCLANPDCEGSGEALAAILERRGTAPTPATFDVDLVVGLMSEIERLRERR